MLCTQRTHIAASSMIPSTQGLRIARSVSGCRWHARDKHSYHYIVEYLSPILQAFGGHIEQLQAAKLATEQKLLAGGLLGLC